jgi:hypothetical protein
MKDVKKFIGQVNLTCNLCTFTFIAYMAYAIYKWQKISGFDNLMNFLVLGFIMAINIKFYLIYAEISSLRVGINDSAEKHKYNDQRKEYRQLARASLWMAIIFAIIKITLK